MTKVSPEFGDQMQMEAVMSVSVDVSFASNRFPKYRIGADNQILDEAKEDPKGPPLKEVVTQETAQLVEQQKRLSVRDLASKFDKNLAAAAKLSDEAKLREVASLEGHVLLKKLRDALESLRGRLAGRNKEDVEKAISMVEALAVKLTQKEGELIQEKFEVKKLANFLKQASEDAKKLVNQERSFACAEIESARAVVQRFGEALEEEERISQTSGKQELDELLEEVQEARRIKLLHQPSKVIDMEHELQALRMQIREKSIISVKLQRELAMSRRAEENKFRVYEFGGSETLGSALRVQPCSDEAQDLSKCSIQWYRIPTEGSRRELISGANKSIYAPEPFDVGRFLEVDVVSAGQKVAVTTSGPIGPAAGLASYVETLLRKPNTEFNVVISQMNGQNYSSRSVHLFHVGPLYAFKRVNKIVCEKGIIAHDNIEPPIAFLDSLLLGEWEDRMQRGLFRYDVTACETKVIPGEYGFIAQLNEGRHLKKRPTEFRVDKVLQPSDGNKFNFTKVGQEEVLFQFEASDEDNETQFFPNAPIDVENSPSVVAINVSPIEYGHVLLIPRILECLPQRIDRVSFLLALYMAAEAGNPYFRLGYNSLGAFATINHLHFQAYYLAVPFPIEKAPIREITTLNGGVKISELLNYPVRGLVFEGGNTLEDLSNAVSDSCICLQDNNVPYNVLISDSGKRIFLVPQCYAEKQALGEVSSELLDTQVNPAVWEISGHMVLKRKKDYEEASDKNAWRLLAEVSLSEERFQEVSALIFESISCVDDGNGSVSQSFMGEPNATPPPLEEVNDLDKSSCHAMVPGKQECLVLH